MQVLMLSDVHFPRVNGVSTSIQSFRQGLERRGVQVRLIAPDYGRSSGLPDDESWIVRLPSRPVPFDPEDRFVRMSRFVAAGRLQVPALIHVQTPFSAHYAGIELGRWHRVPVIATYHTFFEEYLHHYLPFLPAGLTRRAAREISRRQCNALDALVVPSTAMRDRLSDYGVSVPMHVLPTGIPLDRFSSGNRASFRQRLGIAVKQPVALFVGRIAHEKNIGFLLDVAARCKAGQPDLRWIFAGEGPALNDLKARARALGLDEQVIWVGYLDRSTELRDCYAAADVFAFASRTETQGLVLLEAMAMGVPVVALSSMGTTDIVGSGIGAVTPRDDIDDFAAQLLDLIRNPDRREKLSIEAVAYARQWSEDSSAAKMAALYRDLRIAHHEARWPQDPEDALGRTVVDPL